MKVIRCPSCGKVHLNQKYCTSCGCYLPPVLEEEEDILRTYLSEPLCTPNEIRTVLYANNIPIMSVADQITQANATQLMSVADQITQANATQLASLTSQLVQAQVDATQRMQTQYILEQLQPFRPYSEKPESQRIGWW